MKTTMHLSDHPATCEPLWTYFYGYLDICAHLAGLPPLRMVPASLGGMIKCMGLALGQSSKSIQLIRQSVAAEIFYRFLILGSCVEQVIVVNHMTTLWKVENYIIPIKPMP